MRGVSGEGTCWRRRKDARSKRRTEFLSRVGVKTAVVLARNSRWRKYEMNSNANRNSNQILIKRCGNWNRRVASCTAVVRASAVRGASKKITRNDNQTSNRLLTQRDRSCSLGISRLHSSNTCKRSSWIKHGDEEERKSDIEQNPCTTCWELLWLDQQRQRRGRWRKFEDEKEWKT